MEGDLCFRGHPLCGGLEHVELIVELLVQLLVKLLGGIPSPAVESNNARLFFLERDIFVGDEMNLLMWMLPEASVGLWWTFPSGLELVSRVVDARMPEEKS